MPQKNPDIGIDFNVNDIYNHFFTHTCMSTLICAIMLSQTNLLYFTLFLVFITTLTKHVFFI